MMKLAIALFLAYILLLVPSTHASQEQFKSATNQLEPTKGQLSVKPLIDNVFQFTSYFQTQDYGFVSANGLVVIDGSEAYLIDTPWTEKDTIQLVRWIKQQGFTLRASISTHSHDDRAAGIGYLNTIGVDTNASELTNSYLKANNKPLAKQAFTGDKLQLANKQIEVKYLSAGHTEDNLVVWLPESKLLFGGCLIKSQASKTMGYIAQASLSEWPNTLDKAKSRYNDAIIVVPGHGNNGGLELLKHTQELISNHLK
ncbi:subclass B1 metallo-beta-lactamase [Shewanella sp. 10N.286.52.B9]|uniref:subclass B1 metallo-beta-lactamase n=1 Tax=Shewanella sp. 10N.286.52.B9 TaxID=1880837 RepID=UPI000C834ADF|nr:subclass B1 metallo-beta-lactamase [Shewanella sp. 10N.286.52.B9]